MTDAFMDGAAWGTMISDIHEHRLNHLPADFTAEVLLNMAEAVEKLPPEHRGPIVDAALKAWGEAASKRA